MTRDNRDIVYKRFVKFSYIAIFFISTFSIINFYYDNPINALIEIAIVTLFIINLKMKYSNSSKIFLLLF
ncbi:MAG: hypothetical protein U9O83_08010, partial [Campylobacterota bacterium]|nr:hypothetical protein [Campylobacterota bacterium]